MWRFLLFFFTNITSTYKKYEEESTQSTKTILETNKSEYLNLDFYSPQSKITTAKGIILPLYFSNHP